MDPGGKEIHHCKAEASAVSDAGVGGRWPAGPAGIAAFSAGVMMLSDGAGYEMRRGVSDVSHESLQADLPQAAPVKERLTVISSAQGYQRSWLEPGQNRDESLRSTPRAELHRGSPPLELPPHSPPDLRAIT